MTEKSTGPERLNAYVTEKYEADGQERTHWTEVGVAFRHREGRGYSLRIRQGLSVSGTLVLMEPRRRDAAQGGEAESTATTFPQDATG